MSDFDAQELFHLAMDASKKGDPEKAIKFFKESYKLDKKPETIYLLAAEYAGLNMYDRAIEAMKEAVSLNANLHSAMLQLGLLYLVTARHAEVEDAVKPLLALDANNYFNRFAKGLVAVANNDPVAATTELQSGIEINDENLPLNKDMSNLIDQLQSKSKDDVQSVEKSVETPDYLLEKYKGKKH